LPRKPSDIDDGRMRDLEEENDELRRKADMLADEVIGIKGELQARMFLLIAACVIGGRAVLRIWEPPNYKETLDAIFAAPVALLLVKWVVEGWKESRWMLVPYLVVVGETIFLAVLHPVAIYACAGACLFAATRTFEVLLNRLLRVLEGLYDAGRKN
jgi:hypothetical protein